MKVIFWCNAHQREATYRSKYNKICCDPKLGGILLACQVVFLEDCEVIETTQKPTETEAS